MIKYTIWIVDDDDSIREGISMALEEKYEIHGFFSAEDSLEAENTNDPDLILLDIGLPGMSGTTALKEFQKIYPNVLIIMITAYEDIRTVITSMKAGVYDYVIKPIYMEGLEVTIAHALETIRLRKEIHHLQEKYLQNNMPCFIGESNSIYETMDLIEMVSQSSDTPVMILGETGTGKELVASAIHYKSPNFKGPFVTINCAAIPKDLIESELFGYEDGAFSGAHSSGKKGLVEAADGGTLFLDEVGDLSMEVQVKLLRFLEDGHFYKLGGTKKYIAVPRIVSATNRDIDKMISQDEFRKDLFYRLGVVIIRVSSLNERQDDILPLASFFLEKYNRKFNKSLLGFSDEVEELLLKYSWSGNVRELKNLMERGVLAAKGHELAVKDLGLATIQPGKVMNPQKNSMGLPLLMPAGMDLPEFHTAVDQFYFYESLKMTQGNEKKAAQLLNLNHHTFRYRKKRLPQ